MWKVFNDNGSESIINDEEYNLRLKSGEKFFVKPKKISNAEAIRIQNEQSEPAVKKSEELEQKRLEQLRIKNEEKLRSEMGPFGKSALTAYKFVAPDAAKETLEGEYPGYGMAKTAGKQALTAAAIGVPITAIQSTIGRIAAGGGVGLADYLATKAIDEEAPTVAGSVASTALGGFGQGVGEIGEAIFKRAYGVSKDLMSKLPIETVSGIIKRLEQKAIEIMSSSKSNKKFVYDDIEKAVDSYLETLPEGMYSPSALTKMRADALAGFDKDEILSLPQLLNREQGIKDEIAKESIKNMSKDLAKGADISKTYGSLKTPEFKYGENFFPSFAGLGLPIFGAVSPTLSRYVPPATRVAGPMLEDYILPQ